jgi:hypothetical protein
MGHWRNQPSVWLLGAQAAFLGRRYVDALANLSDWLKRGGSQRDQVLESHLDISNRVNRSS